MELGLSLVDSPDGNHNVPECHTANLNVWYKPANVAVHISVLAASSTMFSSCDNLWRIAVWFTCPQRSSSQMKQKSFMVEGGQSGSV